MQRKAGGVNIDPFENSGLNFCYIDPFLAVWAKSQVGGVFTSGFNTPDNTSLRI
jgi:hypothetical protein